MAENLAYRLSNMLEDEAFINNRRMCVVNEDSSFSKSDGCSLPYLMAIESMVVMNSFS